MKLMPYWLDTSEPGPDRSGTEVAGEVDVAVVGAGLTGLSAALHLARRGARVAILEKETVAWGASGRNGGMCSPGLAIGIGQAIARYGLPSAKAFYQLYEDAVETVEKLAAEEGIDCHFARTGKMKVAAKPGHVATLRKNHQILTERLGVQVHLIPKGDLDAQIGSNAFHGALLDPSGAGLHVGKFTRGLGEAAARQGAVIHEKAPVVKIRRLGSGTRHELTTPRGTLRADQVFVATSGYTSRPFRWQQVRIAPVGSFIIVTEPLGKEICDQLLPNRRLVATSKNLVNYFRITPDHRLLFGGRAVFAMSVPEADERTAPILRNAMVNVFPQLADARIDYTWGGRVDMTLDRMVHAGEHDGLYYSMGYSGHGVQMATHMGKLMAEYLSGNTAADPWGDQPFKRIPGHFGPPWFLPFAGGYYRLLDRIK
jgi:glycine/D-amino acid oxidase-like deaminating enzyme